MRDRRKEVELSSNYINMYVSYLYRHAYDLVMPTWFVDQIVYYIAHY